MASDVLPEIGEHLDKICEHTVNNWGCESPIIFDLFDIHPDQRTEANDHPAIHLFRSAQAAGLRAVPSCGLDRDAAFEDAIGQILANMDSHLIIRLQQEDAHAPTIAIPRLMALLSKLGISPSDATIVMDFREIQEPHQPLIGPTISLLNHLTQVGQWNRIVTAGSAMPKSVAERVDQSTQGYVLRLEEQLWSEVASQSDVPISYGDYTVVNPEYVDLDPRIYANTIGPSIRYTTDDSWLITRGSRFRNHPDGYDQYYSLAQQVVASNDFKGTNYSFGDEYIADRAQGNEGTGNPGTWLSAGINHHITLLSEKLTAG